jgi:predicted phage terminase large subunit-like protein
MLHGFKVRFDRESKGKELRADPYASQVGAGNVYLVRGPWVRAFLDEHEVFPAGKLKDQVDAMSGAYFALISMPTASDPDGGWSG